MGIAVGDVVAVVGLQSRPDLNGRRATVISRDSKRERWNVFVDGEEKKLSLREDNLERSDVTPEGSPPEVVSVRGKTAVVKARRTSDGSTLVRFEGGGGKEEWVRKATPLDAADEESVPTELMVGSRVLARDAHKRGGPLVLSDATVSDVRCESRGRLWILVEWDEGTPALWLTAEEVRAAPLAAEDDEAEADDFDPTPSINPLPGRTSKKRVAASAAALGASSSSAAAAASSSAAACASKEPRAPTVRAAKGKAAAQPSAVSMSHNNGPRASRSGEVLAEGEAADGRIAHVLSGEVAGADAEGTAGKLKAGLSKGARKRPRSTAEEAGGTDEQGPGARGQGPDKTRWSRKNRSASDAWEAALDAMQPAEGDEEHEGGSPGTAAPAAPAAPSRDPRMKGFRIGGQAESAEERGEGWCGPWATASRLIEQRENARVAREEEAAAKGAEPEPLFRWTPRRDSRTARPRPRSPLPSLQELCVSFLVANIDAVASFGILSPGIQHAIASSLCSQRKFDDNALGLLSATDAGVSELAIPDCSHLSEAAMFAALCRLVDGVDPNEDSLNPHASPAYAPPAYRTSRLSVVDLGMCGRPLTAKCAAVLGRADCLRTLRLGGCFRLSTSAVVSLLEARGPSLVDLTFSANSQVGPQVVEVLGTHCASSLQSLRLEDCDQFLPEWLPPLSRLHELHTLSLSGLCLLSDDALVTLLDGCAARLKTLSLRGCSLLGPEAIITAARLCPALTSLDLEGVELLTDAAALALAEGCPALQTLTLKGCVQLSDEAIEAISDGCRGLCDVSLNKIPALSDRAILALRTHNASSLRTLDLSWCRGLTDHGLGALVDATEGRLERLSLWGCSQLTATFYEGHSNDRLRIIGRPTLV